jgi:hypothetical protein
MTDKFVEAFTALDAKGKTIVKLKLSHPTANYADLGRLMDPPISRQAIYEHISTKPQIQQCIDIVEMDAVRGIQSLYPLAIVNLRTLLLSKDESVKADITKFVLKKVADSDQVLPDRLDDSELEFIYTDADDSPTLTEELKDGKEGEQEKGTEKTDAEKG